jgi:hypothetical protein
VDLEKSDFPQEDRMSLSPWRRGVNNGNDGLFIGSADYADYADDADDDGTNGPAGVTTMATTTATTTATVETADER